MKTSNLGGPNRCTGFIKSKPFFRLCTGGELFQQLSQKGKYTEADAAAIMRQVLQVVADCHINGVIHRDLKPENFLFNNTTESAVLKVTDFGLSDFFKPETVFKDVAGSAYYVGAMLLLQCQGYNATVTVACLQCHLDGAAVTVL